MKYARNRLIGYGVLICALGVLFMLVATNVAGSLFASLGRTDPIGAAIIEYVVALLRFAAVPLGAMLIALGIALHLVERGKELDKPDEEPEDGAGSAL